MWDIIVRSLIADKCARNVKECLPSRVSALLGDGGKYSGHSIERYKWFTFGPVPRVQQREHDMISRRSFGH